MGHFLALLMFLDSGTRYEMVLHFKQFSQFPEVEQNVEQKSGPFGGTTDKKKKKLAPRRVGHFLYSKKRRQKYIDCVDIRCAWICEQK